VQLLSYAVTQTTTVAFSRNAKRSGARWLERVVRRIIFWFFSIAFALIITNAIGTGHSLLTSE
jgi:hypothetical protein